MTTKKKNTKQNNNEQRGAIDHHNFSRFLITTVIALAIVALVIGAVLFRGFKEVSRDEVILQTEESIIENEQPDSPELSASEVEIIRADEIKKSENVEFLTVSNSDEYEYSPLNSGCGSFSYRGDTFSSKNSENNITKSIAIAKKDLSDFPEYFDFIDRFIDGEISALSANQIELNKNINIKNIFPTNDYFSTISISLPIYQPCDFSGSGDFAIAPIEIEYPNLDSAYYYSNYTRVGIFGKAGDVYVSSFDNNPEIVDLVDDYIVSCEEELSSNFSFDIGYSGYLNICINQKLLSTPEYENLVQRTVGGLLSDFPLIESNSSLRNEYTNDFFYAFRLIYPNEWEFTTSTKKSRFYDGLLERSIKLSKNETTLEIYLEPYYNKSCDLNDNSNNIPEYKTKNGIGEFNIGNRLVYSSNINCDKNQLLRSNISVEDIPGYEHLDRPNDDEVVYYFSISTNNTNIDSGEVKEIREIISNSTFF